MTTQGQQGASTLASQVAQLNAVRRGETFDPNKPIIVDDAAAKLARETAEKVAQMHRGNTRGAPLLTDVEPAPRNIATEAMHRAGALASQEARNAPGAIGPAVEPGGDRPVTLSEAAALRSQLVNLMHQSDEVATICERLLERMDATFSKLAPVMPPAAPPPAAPVHQAAPEHQAPPPAAPVHVGMGVLVGGPPPEQGGFPGFHTTSDVAPASEGLPPGWGG